MFDEQKTPAATIGKTDQLSKAAFRRDVRLWRYELIKTNPLRRAGPLYQFLRFQLFQCGANGLTGMTQKTSNLLGAGQTRLMPVEEHQNIPIAKK